MKKESLIDLRKKTLKELENYYLEYRKYEYENNIPLKGIEIRKKIHKILLSLIKIERVLSKEKIEIINDKHKNTDKPVIFACTHVGGNDIQRTFEAIKDHAYLFLGDPGEIYRDLTGVILKLNGFICLETRNKSDRYIAGERAKELLNKNGNLLIFPEGAWNISDNLPVMKLFPGTIKMALETGAEIVPIAIEQYDNKFYINIGENYLVDESISVQESNIDLRNKLATLKWEIWEKQGMDKRTTIPNNFLETFQNEIVSRCEYDFSINDVLETMYKDKNEVSADEVFAFRKKISR